MGVDTRMPIITKCKATGSDIIIQTQMSIAGINRVSGTNDMLSVKRRISRKTVGRDD